MAAVVEAKILEGRACRWWESSGEHEEITCDRFEATARVGGGQRRVVVVPGLGRQC